MCAQLLCLHVHVCAHSCQYVHCIALCTWHACIVCMCVCMCEHLQQALGRVEQGAVEPLPQRPLPGRGGESMVSCSGLGLPICLPVSPPLGFSEAEDMQHGRCHGHWAQHLSLPLPLLGRPLLVPVLSAWCPRRGRAGQGRAGRCPAKPFISLIYYWPG